MDNYGERTMHEYERAPIRISRPRTTFARVVYNLSMFVHREPLCGVLHSQYRRAFS